MTKKSIRFNNAELACSCLSHFLNIDVSSKLHFGVSKKAA